MKKQTTTIIMTICLMSLVLGYYPGDILEFENEMGTQDLVYTIIENSTNIENINIEINETMIKIEFPQDMPPNEFKIIFIEKETKEVVKIVSSGGGSRTKYVDKNITTTQPLFFDRNITKVIVEDCEKIVEEIKEEPILEKEISIINKILLTILIVITLLYAIKRIKKISRKV